ncbi:MAG TPA: hypothetical protein VM076_08250 [Gemmatimonadaceae bacterium]|nr:hypothetical protein [Gemmatimonadaceae bacterium]
MRSPAPLSLAVSLGLAFIASTARAQAIRPGEGGSRAKFLALNVAIGTTASMARAVVTGTPIASAIAKGLVGGSMMGAGMQLISTQTGPTRFAGLQLTAIGASIADNTAPGSGLISDITLPIYPLYVRIRPGSSTPVTARISSVSAARLIGVLSDSKRPRMDWGATLATGAPVLRSPRWRLPSESCPPPCEGAFAQHNAGVIVYSASAGVDYDLRRTLAHESLHLAQQTRDALLDAIPASDAALARAGTPGRVLSRFVVLDFLMPLRLIDEGELRMRGARRRDSWYEREARAFAPGGELH